MTGWRDAWRFAVGTLTALPTPPPGTVDRRVAGAAMVLAPVVGFGLALAPIVLVGVVDERLAPLPTAVLVVGLLAVQTRALHLDGLADTFDGLGSGRGPASALDVMRRGDVGPFGVVAVVLVLLVQVGALAQAVALGRGAGALLVGLGVSRLALPLACHRSVPAARGDGLGATVAATVSTRSLAGAALVPAAAGVFAVVALALPASRVAVAYLLAGLVTLATLRLGRTRLGGITGDVLGACVELAFGAALVGLAWR